MDDCTICLEPMDNAELMYKLNCNHQFHRECVSEWLRTSPICPLCRTNVDADRRYVNDDIITEERRASIGLLSIAAIMAAKGLEWLFPSGLQGYTEKVTTVITSQDGQKAIEQLYNNLNDGEKGALYRTSSIVQRLWG